MTTPATRSTSTRLDQRRSASIGAPPTAMPDAQHAGRTRPGRTATCSTSTTSAVDEIELVLETADGDEGGPGARRAARAGAARHHHRDAVLRSIDAHARLLRARRQSPGRRRDQHHGLRQQRREGRVADRHRADAARDRRRHRWSCATRCRARRTWPRANCDARVINAGDGWHAHPTQGLLDLYTMREPHRRRCAGKRVVIVGDVLHSRVARSNIWGLTKMGAEVVVCGPPTLLPAGLGGRARRRPAAGAGRHRPRPRHRRRRRRDDAAAAEGAQAGGLLPSLREYSRLYQVNDDAHEAAQARRAGDAPRPDERGRRDHAAALAHGAASADRRAGRRTASPCAWRCSTCMTRHGATAMSRRLRDPRRPRARPGAAAVDGVADVLSKTAHRRVSARCDRRAAARGRSTRAALVVAPGSSTCTRTCASRASSTRRRSRPARWRRRAAASRPSAPCPTPTRRWTTAPPSSSSCAQRRRRRRRARAAHRLRDQGPRRQAAGRAGRAGRRRLHRLQRRRRAGRRRRASCAAPSNTPRPSTCRSSTTARTRSWQGGVMHEGWVSTRLGLKGIPAAVRREHGRARHRAGAADRRARAHRPPQHGRQRRPGPPRQSRRRAGHGGGHAAPPGADRTRRSCAAPAAHGAGLRHQRQNVPAPALATTTCEACIEGLRDGTIDAIATDHAPHAVQEKLCEFDDAAFGIVGLETALALVLTNAVDAAPSDARARHRGADSRSGARPRARPLRTGNRHAEGGRARRHRDHRPQADWLVDPARLRVEGQKHAAGRHDAARARRRHDFRRPRSCISSRGRRA